MRTLVGAASPGGGSVPRRHGVECRGSRKSCRRMSLGAPTLAQQPCKCSRHETTRRLLDAARIRPNSAGANQASGVSDQSKAFIRLHRRSQTSSHNYHLVFASRSSVMKWLHHNRPEDGSVSAVMPLLPMTIMSYDDSIQIGAKTHFEGHEWCCCCQRKPRDDEMARQEHESRLHG